MKSNFHRLQRAASQPWPVRGGSGVVGHPTEGNRPLRVRCRFRAWITQQCDVVGGSDDGRPDSDGERDGDDGDDDPRRHDGRHHHRPIQSVVPQQVPEDGDGGRWRDREEEGRDDGGRHGEDGEEGREGGWVRQDDA